jgi:hypothetical protein
MAYYLPFPPRAWSRVQDSCSVTTNIDNNGYVKLPYSNELVPASSIGYHLDMINKGNVLQYKSNSANFTKKQKYSKIAKGQWVNRNTTWATQNTRGYTNPNTTFLKRVNSINIALDPVSNAIIGPTTNPVTKIQPINPLNIALPPQQNPNSVNSNTLPPQPTNSSTNITLIPVVPNPVPEAPIVIQDGGSLICSIQENPYTGKTTNHLSQKLYNPTSDSDVPGKIELLYWNDGTPTWYPRQRYNMSNSDNKWPQGYKGFTSAVKFDPPVITSITNESNIITLLWTQTNSCIVVNKFIIYQNGSIVKEVNGDIFTTTVTVNNSGTYQYYIVSENGYVLSDPSNIVSITITITTI